MRLIPSSSTSLLTSIAVVATVFCILTAFVADRLHHRYSFTLLGICVATVGYGILFNQDRVTVAVQYFAVYLIVTGGYIVSLILARTGT